MSVGRNEMGGERLVWIGCKYGDDEEYMKHSTHFVVNQNESDQDIYSIASRSTGRP